MTPPTRRITQTIREEFAESTLLVIAHRLRTIIDFDRVLLLDKGELIEFESPAKLLEDPTSRFYALARATGKKEFAILRKMAKGRARVTHKPRKVRLSLHTVCSLLWLTCAGLCSSFGGQRRREQSSRAMSRMGPVHRRRTHQCLAYAIIAVLA